MVPSDADRDVEDGAAFSLDYVGHFVWSTLTLSEDYRRDVKFAETSLRAAQSAVQATGKPVKVETAIESGLSSVKLISESRDADLVCVGCTGMGGYARALLGSTAADVAEKAHCSVAVIRASDGRPSQDINWVIVAVNDAPDSEAVVEGAMVEAALRRAPVLAVGAESKDMDHDLERRVQELRRRYPDVHVYPVATDDGIGRFLEDNRERVQLVVIGSSDAGQLARVVGPHGHPVIGTPVFGSSGSSALSLEEAVVDDAESGLQVLVGLVEIGRELADVVVQ